MVDDSPTWDGPGELAVSGPCGLGARVGGWEAKCDLSGEELVGHMIDPC